MCWSATNHSHPSGMKKRNDDVFTADGHNFASLFCCQEGRLGNVAKGELCAFQKCIFIDFHSISIPIEMPLHAVARRSNVPLILLWAVQIPTSRITQELLFVD